MTENWLQILFYLFRHQDNQDALQNNNVNLLETLRDLGVSSQTARKMMTWLDECKQINYLATPASTSMRFFTHDEIKKLDVAARGFIHSLQQTGLLDDAKCELIIAAAMSLDLPRVYLKDLHGIIRVILRDGKPQDIAVRNAYFLLLLSKSNPH